MSGPPQQPFRREKFGKYELLAPFATGGTAEVFLARLLGESGFQKIIIVKRLLDHLVEDSDFVAMFLDEGRLGARLEHSNIVQTLDLGEVDGRYYMALEYLAGLNLEEIVERARTRLRGGLPPDLVLGIVSQACAGLHYAHELALPDGTKVEIVHRDVSPQNLIVTFEGVVKVLDFGIAKAQAVRESKTQGGMIKGKFAYMAPEQCLGKALDRRTDIFALGVVAHELLTGGRLFRRESVYQTFAAIAGAEEIPPPSRINRSLDPAIDPIVMRALAYRPEDRWATAEELGEALDAHLRRRGVQVTQGAIARFLEKHFGDEIAAKNRQIRALVGGTGAEEVVDDVPTIVGLASLPLAAGDDWPAQPTNPEVPGALRARLGAPAGGPRAGPAGPAARGAGPAPPAESAGRDGDLTTPEGFGGLASRVPVPFEPEEQTRPSPLPAGHRLSGSAAPRPSSPREQPSRAPAVRRAPLAATGGGTRIVTPMPGVPILEQLAPSAALAPPRASSSSPGSRAPTPPRGPRVATPPPGPRAPTPQPGPRVATPPAGPRAPTPPPGPRAATPPPGPRAATPPQGVQPTGPPPRTATPPPGPQVATPPAGPRVATPPPGAAPAGQPTAPPPQDPRLAVDPRAATIAPSSIESASTGARAATPPPGSWPAPSSPVGPRPGGSLSPAGSRAPAGANPNAPPGVNRATDLFAASTMREAGPPPYALDAATLREPIRRRRSRLVLPLALLAIGVGLGLVFGVLWHFLGR